MEILRACTLGSEEGRKLQKGGRVLANYVVARGEGRQRTMLGSWCKGLPATQSVFCTGYIVYPISYTFNLYPIRVAGWVNIPFRTQVVLGIHSYLFKYNIYQSDLTPGANKTSSVTQAKLNLAYFVRQARLM